MQPRTQLENASLVIEREKRHIYGARGAKFGRRWPKNATSVIHKGQTPHVLASEVVCAESIINLIRAATL